VADRESRETHDFLEGEIYSTGVVLDNVCAFWKNEKYQCIKSKIAHPPYTKDGLPARTVREPSG
jgi:hypothetical protein